MRSKHIIAIVTFFTCFAVSSFLVGMIFPNDASNTELNQIVNLRPQADAEVSEKILVLLQQDGENGDQRDDEIFDYWTENERVFSLTAKTRIFSDYAKNSATIDDSGLPQDFQTAWRKHMDAWADYSDFLRKVENAKMSSENINRVERQYESDINSTWYEVLHIARSYGAEFYD
jgi:hypothetical protein